MSRLALVLLLAAGASSDALAQHLVETKLSVDGTRDDVGVMGGASTRFSYTQDAQYSLMSAPSGEWGLSSPDFARIMLGAKPPAHAGQITTFPPPIHVVSGSGEYHYACNQDKGTVQLSSPRAAKNQTYLKTSHCAADGAILFWLHVNEGELDMPANCTYPNGGTQRGLRTTYPEPSKAAFEAACPGGKKQSGVFIGKVTEDELTSGEWIDLPARYSVEKDMPRTGGGTLNVMLRVRSGAAKLRAVPGGPYSVERGKKVNLDGSRSTGSITKWTWKLTPDASCPAGVPPATLDGRTVAVTLLCPMKAELTVTDGRTTDDESTAVNVTARSWKTNIPANVVAGSNEEHLRVGCAVGGCKLGRNSCAPHGTFDTDDIVHNGGDLASYEGDAFVIGTVDDAKSPFHGWFWIAQNKSRIERRSYLNPELRPESVTAQKNGASADYRKLVQSVIAHEQFHTDVYREQLQAHGDPAKKMEDIFGRDRADVLTRANDPFFKLSEYMSGLFAGNETLVHQKMQRDWGGKRVKVLLRVGESETTFGEYDFGGKSLADLGD